MHYMYIVTGGGRQRVNTAVLSYPIAFLFVCHDNKEKLLSMLDNYFDNTFHSRTMHFMTKGLVTTRFLFFFIEKKRPKAASK